MLLALDELLFIVIKTRIKQPVKGYLPWFFGMKHPEVSGENHFLHHAWPAVFVP